MLFSLIAFALGAAIAFVVGHYARLIGARLGLLDFPDGAGGRKLHANVTPLVGGLAIIAAAVAAVALLWGWDLSASQQALLGWFAITASAMYLIGIADDRFGLSARFRLGMATVVLLLAILRVPSFKLGFLLFTGQDELILLTGAVGLGFTLLCLVGLLNAVNMADGKNGLVIGQALIWSAVMCVRLPAWLVPLVAMIAGALLILFCFNMKGRLFLGDGGSYGLSAIFGLLAITAWNEGFADFRVDDIALIFAIPVFDTLRLMVQRVLCGTSPFTAGTDHLHHYLGARWRWPGPLPWVLALVAIPNFGAILLPGTAPFWLAVSFAGYVCLIGVAQFRLPVRS